MILKWFAEFEQATRGARARPHRPRRGGVAEAYGVPSPEVARARGADRGAALGDRRPGRPAARAGAGRHRHVARLRCAGQRAGLRRIAPTPPRPPRSRPGARPRPTGSRAARPSRCAASCAGARAQAASRRARSTSSATPPTRAPTARSRGRWRSRATSRTSARCLRSHAARRPRSCSAPAARASTASRRPTASSSTAAATSRPSTSRTTASGAGAAGGGARPRQQAARPPRPPARPRPGEHRDRLHRRRGREQLRRDALRGARRLLPHGLARCTFVLANGAVIDTAAPDAEERFAAAAPELARGLAEIRDELRADDELCARIARKFEIKNTDRLPAVRVPRRRRAARDLPAAARRLGGHARVRRARRSSRRWRSDATRRSRWASSRTSTPPSTRSRSSSRRGQARPS